MHSVERKGREKRPFLMEKNFVRQLKKKNEQALLHVIDHYGWVLKTVVKRQMGTLPHL